MGKKHIFIFLTAVLASFFLFSKSIYAIEHPSTKITVDHIAGFFEKVEEKITLFFQFSHEAKASYREYLTEKRFAELVYIVDSNQIDSIEETSSRYSTYLSNLTNYVVDEKITSKKQELLDMFAKHRAILEILRNEFKFESGWWLMLQQNIDLTNMSNQKVQSI